MDALSFNQKSKNNPQGWSGLVQELHVFDIFQMILQAGLTKIIQINSVNTKGIIAFENGEILHVSTEFNEGEEALYEIIQSVGGTFRELENNELENYPQNIFVDTMFLLLEASRIVDESKNENAQISKENIPVNFDGVLKSTILKKAIAPDILKTTIDLSLLEEIKGFIGACIVEIETGKILGKRGGNGINFEKAAKAQAMALQAKMAMIESLNIKDNIEEVLIGLSNQNHILHLLPKYIGLFSYVIIDSKYTDLASIKAKIREFELGL